MDLAVGSPALHYEKRQQTCGSIGRLCGIPTARRDLSKRIEHYANAICGGKHLVKQSRLLLNDSE
jgi:hypothetical protein